jgi:hypothetical protein
LYDAYQVTEFRPYEYDDPWFDTNGGGKFLLDQDASYDIEVRGLSTFRATQAAYNHIDLVFKSSGRPHLWEVAGAGVASDENDELPPYENRSISSNGVTLRTIPIGPNWGAYATAIHELGHLMDHTAYNSTISGYTSAGKAGFGGEARAQLARRYAGIDRPVHGGYGTPFNACYYREQERYGYEGVFPEDEDAAWDHGGGRADDLGEAFWGYLVEHFDAGTSAIVSDDLAARYITATTYRNGDERFVNMYLYSMAQILGEAHYDDTTLYPYFSDASGPLAGDERLGTLFHNFGIAVGANAPWIGNGEYGFPFEFRPTYNWQYFIPISPNEHDVETPAETEVLASDFGFVRTVPSPYEMPTEDASQGHQSFYQLQVHPWNHEMWAFHINPTADPGANREVMIRVIGQGEPYEDSGSAYSNEVKASLVTFSDLQGGWIHESADKVIAVDHLDGEVVNSNLEFVGVIPTYAGARAALLVLTMAEMNMPEFFGCESPSF